MESFLYTVLNFPKKWQYSLFLQEEALCVSIPNNTLLTQPRIENVGPTVNPMWILGCCSSLCTLQPTVAWKSPIALATALHMM